MTVLSTLKAMTTCWMSPKKENFSDIIATIKGYYADTALMCSDEESTEFLRQLNRCDNLQDLWGVRASFYTLLARNFGEIEAKQHTKIVEVMYAPYIRRGEIRGIDTNIQGGKQNFKSTLGQSLPGVATDDRDYLR